MSSSDSLARQHVGSCPAIDKTLRTPDISTGHLNFDVLGFGVKAPPPLFSLPSRQKYATLPARSWVSGMQCQSSQLLPIKPISINHRRSHLIPEQGGFGISHQGGSELLACLQRFAFAKRRVFCHLG